MGPMRVGYTYHCHATKEWVVKEILKYGGNKVLRDFSGTNIEAIALVMKDPGEYIVIGECDNKNDDGTCAGHLTGEDDGKAAGHDSGNAGLAGGGAPQGQE